MSVRGRLGVRLKVDPLALAAGLDEVAAALQQHVGHVWTFAQSEPAADGVASVATIGRLTFGWTGPQANAVDDAARKRIEQRLGDALAQLATRPAPSLPAAATPTAAPAPAKVGPGLTATGQPAPEWSYREIEFFAVLEEFLTFVTEGRKGVLPVVDQLRVRYDAVLADTVPAVVWLVDVREPASWRPLIETLLDLALRRFGRGAPYVYIWDNGRRDGLIALDPAHLKGEIPPLKMPPTPPPENRDFLVAADTRLAFVACALPELTAADVATFEAAWQVDVPLGELIQSGMVPRADLMKFYRLTDEQVTYAITDALTVPVRVVPLTVRQRVRVASLNVLMLEYVQSIDINAHLFGQLLLLSDAALKQLPPTVAVRIRAATDDATLRARDEPDQKADSWRTGWRGVFVHPLLDGFREYGVRSKAIAQVRDTKVTALVAILNYTDSLADFIDHFPEDPILFEALLDGLARLGILDRFFDVIRQAKGNKWEWDRPRQFKVSRLAFKTRHRNNPALLALVNSLKFQGFQQTALTGPQHTFDLASQSVYLLGKKSRRVQARGASQDDKAGVVAEVNDYYSEVSTVYQPGKELMERLSAPTRKKIGEIAMRMACSASETMTETQLIGEAIKAAMKELSPPPEKKDFVAVKMRRSVRVLSLAEPIIDGVPQLRIKCEPVAKVGDDGQWQAIGPAEDLSPGRFDAELRYFHVQHMVNALGVFMLATAVVGSAIFIVVAGIASLGELVVMIIIGEAMYLWTTPREERSLQGFLMAALIAELDLVGFKALSFVSKSGLRFIAGRVLTGELVGSTVTKWIAFGLRGTVTAAEVGAVGMLDLFANELFRATRCRGFSSGEEYWGHFKAGFKIGLVFEFVAVPWLAPVARLGIEKASTYLEAAQILQKSGKGLGEIASTLLRGQRGLEEALGRTLEPKLAEPIARSFKDQLDRLFTTLGREYKSRAYGAVFDLLDVNLSRAGREGLSRLLGTLPEKEIDRLLVTLKAAKIAPADFLRVVGELDAQMLAEILSSGNLTKLAQSPKVLSFLTVNQPAALRILRGPFNGAVDSLERYLGELERLPAPSRVSVLEALLATPGGTAEWANLLLRAARSLGPLDTATVEWLGRLQARKVPIDPLLVALKEAKVLPADFLRVVGEFDAQALTEMFAGNNLRQLARSPRVLSFLASDQATALKILRGPFRGSIDAFERRLAEIERLPAPNRASALEDLSRDPPTRPRPAPPPVAAPPPANLGQLNAELDEILRTGPRAARPSAERVVQARTRLRSGTANAEDIETLLRETVVETRAYLQAARKGELLSWDELAKNCGPGRDVSTASLGTLAAESQRSIQLLRFQSEEVFGVNKHGFSVVTFSGNPKTQYLIDTTFSQFMRPGGAVPSVTGPSAEVLRGNVEGMALARDLARDGFIPLTEQNAAQYARALGVPDARAAEFGKRLLTGENALTREFFGGRTADIPAGGERGPIIRETGPRDIIDASESLHFVRQHIKDVTARGDPRGLLPTLRELEGRLKPLVEGSE